MVTALLLIAHGSRNPEANADLHQLALELRGAQGFAIVEPSFLEVTEPTIPQGGERCVAAGAARVVLAPYFLSAGRHVRDDLERHRAELAARFAGVEFLLAEPLGPHPLLMEILLQRVREVCAGPDS